MTKSVLTVDIGNTNIKVSTVLGHNAVKSVAVMPTQQFCELGHWHSKGQKELTQAVERTEMIVVSSVVPAADHLMRLLLPSAAFLTSETPLPQQSTPLNITAYQNGALGKDRYLAILAATFLYPQQPVVVVDAGTTVTIDVVDNTGMYQGGLILPGPEAVEQALVGGRAALLSQLLSWHTQPKAVLALNTTDCLKSGLAFGYAGMVQYPLQLIAQQHPYNNAVLVLTGGAAERIMPTVELMAIEATYTFEHNPNLLPIGMWVYANNILG